MENIKSSKNRNETKTRLTQIGNYAQKGPPGIKTVDLAYLNAAIDLSQYIISFMQIMNGTIEERQMTLKTG